MKIISRSKIWISFSATLVGISVLALLIWGLKPGIDFTGGSLIRLEFDQVHLSQQQIDEALGDQFGSFEYQPVNSNEIILKFRNLTEDEHQEILTALNNEATKVSGKEEQGLIKEDKFNSIGPSIGQELRQKSKEAIIVVLIAIVAYIAWAFRGVSNQLSKYESFRYGIIAIIALMHDILITLGVFAILGHFLNVEVDSFFIAALLTTLGYSVNDTIIIFDRIRENLTKGAGENFSQTVEISLRQTFTRSLFTSLTTLLVLFAILVFGGDSTFYFVLALIVGVIVGTYSSIFLAAPILVWWKKRGFIG